MVFGITKLFSLISTFKNFSFQAFFVNSFGNIFLINFLPKLLNNPNCSIYVSNKKRIQSLTKKDFIIVEKNLAHFVHHILIIKIELMVQIWYLNTISSQLKILYLNLSKIT